MTEPPNEGQNDKRIVSLGTLHGQVCCRGPVPSADLRMRSMRLLTRWHDAAGWAR